MIHARWTSWTLALVLGMLLGGARSANAGATPRFEDAAREMPVRRDKSQNGKSIEEMREQVKQTWSSIVFQKDGKPVEYVAEFETEAGTIEMEFFPDKAPNHVRSFIALTKAGYYNGLSFHRCIPGFMVQGGCPYGDGMGGPGYNLKQEFNDVNHTRGVLSAARAMDPNSAGSQFFLCVDKADFLDGQYTAFGRVTKGMDAADKIVVTGQGRPNGIVKNPLTINKATIKIKGEK